MRMGAEKIVLKWFHGSTESATAGTKVYNKIPEDIKNINDLIKFKNKLKDVLIKKSFYTLPEFFECKF
jgi:hypothetical protein